MTLLLLNKHSRRQAIRLLLLVAVAPFLGAASTLFLKIPEGQMPLYLGFLAGFLLYIGASHVLPQAHQDKSGSKSEEWVLHILGDKLFNSSTDVLNLSLEKGKKPNR